MNNPFASDGNLIDPQAEDTRGFLRIAVSAANGPNATKKVKLTPAAVKAFLIRLAEEPEWRQVWDGYGKGPKKPPVSIVCAVWARDGLGRKHCRIVGARMKHKRDPLAPVMVVVPSKCCSSASRSFRAMLSSGM